MPGFSHIFGFFPLYNNRILDRDKKPRTHTYDADVVIGLDDTGEVQTVSALVQFFVSQDAYEPVEGTLHFIHGMICSFVPESMLLSDCSPVDYELLIDADFVRILWLTICHC
jgi:hypothetical protein